MIWSIKTNIADEEYYLYMCDTEEDCIKTHDKYHIIYKPSGLRYHSDYVHNIIIAYVDKINCSMFERVLTMSQQMTGFTLPFDVILKAIKTFDN